MMIRNWTSLPTLFPPHNPSEALPVPSKSTESVCIFSGKGKKLADSSLLPLLSLVEKKNRGNNPSPALQRLDFGGRPC